MISLPCRFPYQPYFLPVLPIVILVSVSCQAGCSTPQRGNGFAAVSIQSPDDIHGVFPGLFATFSSSPSGGKLVAVVPPSELSVDGCSAAPVPSVTRTLDAVSVVRRGNCSFLEKALIAQQAGAKGIVVVSDDEMLQLMGPGNLTHQASNVHIFIVTVAKSVGDKIIARSAQTPVMISCTVYRPSFADLSSAVLVLLATALIIAGAQFASSDLRRGSPIAPHKSEVVELDETFGFGFCVMGSLMLVFLFFLMKYLIYALIFGFCAGGVSCITQIGSIALKHFFADLGNKAPCTKLLRPIAGPISYADIIALFPALAVVCSWLFLRNEEEGWIFQDIIGAAFLVWIQRTLRLPSMKVAAILLSLMFFFDVFWVFISPLLFRKSVMVEVATGGHSGLGGGTHESVPMLLRIPAFNDELGRDRMLGFGDVALPGTLVSFLRRHDVRSQRSFFGGYFFPSVIGYFLGLCVTLAALAFMKMGQPALLYLVPGTLGTTVVLARCKGELGDLWDGRPSSSTTDDESTSSNIEAQKFEEDSESEDD